MKGWAGHIERRSVWLDFQCQLPSSKLGEGTQTSQWNRPYRVGLVEQHDPVTQPLFSAWLRKFSGRNGTMADNDRNRPPGFRLCLTRLLVRHSLFALLAIERNLMDGPYWISLTQPEPKWNYFLSWFRFDPFCIILYGSMRWKGQPLE